MDFVLLQSFDNYIDAHIVLAKMEEEGIQCWLKDENTVTLTPIFNNVVGGIKLMVAKEQLERATALLNHFDNEKKNKFSCPRCGSHNIELIAARKPLNILGALVTWLTGSYAMSTDNVWHCFNCDEEFKEPVEKNSPAEDKFVDNE
jgi:Zn finger protein HypA/HybF involved in hydrogenase expression